jgi:hypothetical protein
MDVWVIPMLVDNLCYLITEHGAIDNDLKTSKPSAYWLVDVSEPYKVKHFFKTLGCAELRQGIEMILTTSKMWHHSKGNLPMKEIIKGLKVVGNQ